MGRGKLKIWSWKADVLSMGEFPAALREAPQDSCLCMVRRGCEYGVEQGPD
jgi:hypothetical protein